MTLTKFCPASKGVTLKTVSENKRMHGNTLQHFFRRCPRGFNPQGLLGYAAVVEWHGFIKNCTEVASRQTELTKVLSNCFSILDPFCGPHVTWTFHWVSCCPWTAVLEPLTSVLTNITASSWSILWMGRCKILFKSRSFEILGTENLVFPPIITVFDICYICRMICVDRLLHSDLLNDY